MIKGAEENDRISEFYEYISDGSVKEAFALLLGTFACYQKVTCRVSPQNKVRSIALDFRGKWCFSIMPSKKKLIFHWRPPVLKMGCCKRLGQALESHFGEAFTDKSHKPEDKHWAVTLTTVEEAMLLLLILDLR